MLHIGLTGGIASGKSTVVTMLRELGAGIVDCDVIAHDVVEPGSEGLAAVAAAFGPKNALSRRIHGPGLHRQRRLWR